MNGVILYQSKTGSTKQFSEWIQEETGFEIHTIWDCPRYLDTYDVTVIGSSVRGGKVAVKDWLIKRWASIKEKKVVMILTSGTGNTSFIEEVIKESLPAEIRSAVKVFPVGGRYVFGKMSFFDRNLIKLVAFFTTHAETKKGMLTERDDVEKGNLKEALDFIKKP